MMPVMSEASDTVPIIISEVEPPYSGDNTHGLDRTDYELPGRRAGVDVCVDNVIFSVGQLLRKAELLLGGGELSAVLLGNLGVLIKDFLGVSPSGSSANAITLDGCHERDIRLAFDARQQAHRSTIYIQNTFTFVGQFSLVQIRLD